MKDIGVIIFEDNKPRKELLKLLLDNTAGFTCLGAYEDCRDVVEIVANTSADIILMDIDMPYVNGIEGLRLLKNNFPNQKVIIQTIFEDDDKIFNAMKAGADGYILKKTNPDKFLDAICDIYNGGIVMTPEIARRVLNFFNQSKIIINHFNLSSREAEVLRYLVRGSSYKMIATSCCVSYSTINTHLKNIYKKLQVSSGNEAIIKALQYNLV